MFANLFSFRSRATPRPPRRVCLGLETLEARNLAAGFAAPSPGPLGYSPFDPGTTGDASLNLANAIGRDLRHPFADASGALPNGFIPIRIGSSGGSASWAGESAELNWDLRQPRETPKEQPPEPTPGEDSGETFNFSPEERYDLDAWDFA